MPIITCDFPGGKDIAASRLTKYRVRDNPDNTNADSEPAKRTCGDPPMPRDIFGDQLAYWCRTHYPAQWAKLFPDVPNQVRRYRLAHITDAVIRVLETLLSRPEPELPVMAREEAARLGLHYWWPGEPCRHGHYAPRYVANGMCVECNRLRMHSYYIRKVREHYGSGTSPLKSTPPL